MKIKIPVLLFVFVALLTDCFTNVHPSSVSSAVTFVDDTDIDTSYVVLSRVDLDEQPLYPMSVFFAGDNLIVQESNGNAKTDLFKIYHNKKLVSRFGTIGQGSDDYKNPFLYDQGNFADSCFWVADIDKFVQINVKADGNVKGVKNVNFPDDIIPVNQVAFYRDSILAFRRTDEYQLSFYNMLSKQRTGYNFYEKPKAAENVSDFELNMNVFRFAYGSCGDYIVSAYYNFKIIDIISAKQQKLIKKLYFKGYDTNPIIVNNDVVLYDLNFVLFFDFVIAKEDCFYVRSWDSPFLEIDKDDIGIPKIYKIDYEGNIQKLYVLKQRIRSFTIKDNEIYAICLDPEEQEWMIYKGKLQ